jgi:hypothetical protein
MAASSFSLTTSVLPEDVFPLYDDEFYKIVKQFVGRNEAKRLKIQSIRRVYSFLYLEDAFNIFSLPCRALDDIKKNMCLFIDDKTYMVKVG